MVNYQNIDETDRKVMQLRALGLHQEEIANQVGMSQSAVSQRIEKIRAQTEGVTDTEKLFWTLLIGGSALYLLSKIFDKK